MPQGGKSCRAAGSWMVGTEIPAPLELALRDKLCPDGHAFLVFYIKGLLFFGGLCYTGSTPNDILSFCIFCIFSLGIITG